MTGRRLIPPEPEKLTLRERLRNRNWFTIASLGTLAVLILYSLLIVWLPGITFTETEIGVLIVLFASSNVTAILSLHFKDSDL